MKEARIIATECVGDGADGSAAQAGSGGCVGGIFSLIGIGDSGECEREADSVTSVTVTATARLAEVAVVIGGNECVVVDVIGSRIGGAFKIASDDHFHHTGGGIDGERGPHHRHRVCR